MSEYEATDQTADSDLWHVQLASGDVCLMTLDQLDDAFQTGVISENTYLWQEGATGWVTLREVAGLDADDSADEVADTATHQQHNPFVQADAISESVWPSAPAAVWPQESSTWPPQPAVANQMFAPTFAPPLQAMGPHSTAPVVSPLNDMDFELDRVDFGKKKHPIRWMFAAALVGAAGFGAVKYKLVSIPFDMTPAVNAAITNPVPPSEPVAAPTPQPPPTPVAAPPPEPTKALPDDVKARLATADKALADKQKARQQQLQQRRAASPRSSRSRPSSGEKVFHKGGETGDPLDSAL
jgi:hypothetical protein